MIIHDSSVSIVILMVAIHSGGAQSAQSRSQELVTAKRPTTSRIHHRTKGVRTKALTPEWIVSEMNYIGAALLKICSSKYATQKLTLKNWQPKLATKICNFKSASTGHCPMPTPKSVCAAARVVFEVLQFQRVSNRCPACLGRRATLARRGPP